MITNHPRQCPGPQEKDRRAQGQEDRANRDQAHRHKRSWAEFYRDTVFMILWLVL